MHICVAGLDEVLGKVMALILLLRNSEGFSSRICKVSLSQVKE